MAWLVFITVCNRLLEALPVFIEINVRARLLCCLCHRCKLWQKENNPVACIAPQFYPSRERAASGSSLCSLVEKALLKANVLDFTASYPMMWSGINTALDLRAGKALVGHLDNFLTSQRMILLAEYLLGLYHACF